MNIKQIQTFMPELSEERAIRLSSRFEKAIPQDV
jgi:hypothetical protein